MLDPVAISSTMEPQPKTQGADEVILSVRNVSKMYRLYDTPQDRLKHALAWRLGKHYGREFWALRDVSFDVRRGESVGIIGRNGSGKSTLLQIIAGTLAHTTGEVQTAGRVAALLELGSGFNPDFTGRENVYLNGAILGVDPKEMEQRFDEIAAFADIGEFIDQPVKVYSSGMVLRLAFAVQAIVRKEVLIVDEALAVGDEAFQRKCMRTLEEFQNAGGTVLLVSHSAQAVVRQCERCLFLNGGELILDGPSKPVTDLYQRFLYGTPQQQQQTLALARQHGSRFSQEMLASLNTLRSTVESNASADPAPLPQHGWDPNIPATTEVVYGNGAAEIFDWCMLDEQERRVNVLVAGQRYTWRYRVRFHEKVRDVGFGMMFKTIDGVEVSAINSFGLHLALPQVSTGQTFEVRFILHLHLAPGTYYVNSGIVGDAATPSTNGGFLQRRVDICAFRVISADSRQVGGIADLQPKLDVRALEPARASELAT